MQADARSAERQSAPSEAKCSALQRGYIGRHTRNGWRKSKWANPFKPDVIDVRTGQIIEKRDGSRDEVVAKFRHWLCDYPELMTALPELRGRDLVCWCAPERCHGEVHIELANRRRGYPVSGPMS